MQPRSDRNNRSMQHAVYQPWAWGFALKEKIRSFFLTQYNGVLADSSPHQVALEKDSLATHIAAMSIGDHYSYNNTWDNTLLPLTAAGRLATKGKFDEAELLCADGANKNAMLVGAAAGGQLDYLQRVKNDWQHNENLLGMMLTVAAYNKQHDVVDELLKYSSTFHALTGAALGGHVDYFAELAADCPPNNLVNMTPVAFDCLRAELRNPHDGLRFLAACKMDQFRKDMAHDLDRFGEISGLQLPYSACYLVERAARIRKNMDEQSLSFEDAYQNEYTVALNQAKQIGEAIKLELDKYNESNVTIARKIYFFYHKLTSLYFDEIRYYPDAPKIVTAFITPIGIKLSQSPTSSEGVYTWLNEAGLGHNTFCVSQDLLQTDKKIRSEIRALPQYCQAAMLPMLQEYDAILQKHNDMLDTMISKLDVMTICRYLPRYSPVYYVDFAKTQDALQMQQYMLDLEIAKKTLEANTTVSGFIHRVTQGFAGFFSSPSRPAPAMAASSPAVFAPQQKGNTK